MSLIQFNRGTKANLPALAVAEPAFTTDTKEVFIGTAEGNVQVGDMLKSTYDTNASGSVDNAEALGGKSSAHHLDRANHTGEQNSSTISDFTKAAQDAIGEMINNTDKSVALTYDEATALLYAEVLIDNATIKKNGLGQLYSVDGTTLTKGAVKLVDSVTNASVNTAATPNSVKTVHDALNAHESAPDAHGINQFLVKNISAGANVAVENSSGTVSIAVPEIGEVNTASNINTAGVGVFDIKAGVNLGFKGIESSDSSLSVTAATARKTIDVKHATVSTTTGTQEGSTVLKSITTTNGHVTDFKTGTLSVADIAGAANIADVETAQSDVDQLKSSGVITAGTVTNNNDATVTLNDWEIFFSTTGRTEIIDDVSADLSAVDGPKIIYVDDTGAVNVSTTYNTISDPSSVMISFGITDGTALSPLVVMPDLAEVPEITRAHLEIIDIPVYKLDVLTSTGLELSRDAGSLLIEGINYTSNGSRNLKSFAPAATIDLLYFNKDGEITLPVTYTTEINPSVWYNPATPDLEAVPEGKYTVQEIRVTVEGKYFVRAGAQLFDTLAEAKNSLSTAQLAPMNGIYTSVSAACARLIVAEGTADLTLDTNAFLTKVTSTGSVSGGTSGVSSGSIDSPISDAENLLYAAANPTAQARFIVSGTSSYSHTLQGKSGTLAHLSDITEYALNAFGSAINNLDTSAATLTYGNGTISADVKVDGASVVKNGTNGNLEVGSISSAKVSDFAEAAQDAIGAAISNIATDAVVMTYDDTAGTIAADVKTDDISIVKNIANGELEVGAIVSGRVIDFKEAAQDAVGEAINNEGKTVALSYDDDAGAISADVNIDSVTIRRNTLNQLYVDGIDGGTF